MLRQADDYLRRHLKSKAVREAEKRRAERQSREAGRRIKRAAVVGGVSGAGILGVGAFVVPLAGAALFAAGGAALLLTAGTLFRPSRRPPPTAISRRPSWPCSPAMRRIGCSPAATDCRSTAGRCSTGSSSASATSSRISATLAPHSTAAWEARRLLGDHLPGLVLAYEAIPPSARTEDPEVEGGSAPASRRSPTHSTSYAARSAEDRS